MAEIGLQPHDGFVAFFGCDGIGKTAVTREIADIMGDQAILMYGSKPETWPGGPPEEDFRALEAAYGQIPEGIHRAVAQVAFTRSIVTANYARVAGLLKASEGQTVLNDSDPLLKALLWAHLEDRPIGEVFQDLSVALEENTDNVFPANIVYVTTPGELDTKAMDIESRLRGRGYVSASDPTSIEGVRQHINANDQVYAFLQSLTSRLGFRVHSVENPSLPTDELSSGLRAVAHNVLNKVGLIT